MKSYILLIIAAVLLIGAVAWAQGGYPSATNSAPNLYLTLDQQNEKQVNVDPYSVCALEEYPGMTGRYGYGPSTWGASSTHGWCW